ncbi:MAG: ABC transporter substrate-binding protein [Clostridiales bacterium]|nr:ABC transporter substrate-binding protein [Clostridiales bacterium]
MKVRILCLLLCSFLLAGCSDFISEDDTSEDDTTARLAILDKESAEGEKENMLSLTMRPPKTLNPLLNEDVTVDKVLKLIYEPLFNISEEQSVIPNLGASYSLSDDGLVMRVTLKDGLKWHNGESITAEDVAYSLDTIRAASEDSVYKYAVNYITDYYMENSLTLVINYSQVYSGAAYNLCFPVIPKYFYDDDILPTVGSGPFALESYDTREYRLKAAAGVNGTPQTEGVRVLISPDYDTDYNAFNQGITNVLNTDEDGWFSFFADKDCNMFVYSDNCFEYFGFNNSLEMFKNQAVRQAVAYCIDREQIVSGIYMNNMDSSLTPVNPTAYMSSEESLARYDYSAEDALASLWNSGLSPYNYTFKILVNEENAERVETANVIAESLNMIGMNVTVDKRPFEEYAELINADEFDTFIGGCRLRAGFDLRPLLLSSASYSGTNYVNFSDSTMDTLLNEAASAVGSDNTKRALGEVERYISVQLPLIGIGFKNGVVMTSSDIKGVTIPYISNCFVGAADWSFG